MSVRRFERERPDLGKPYFPTRPSCIAIVKLLVLSAYVHTELASFLASIHPENSQIY